MTFLGPFYRRRAPDKSEDWERGITRTVTQAWLDEWKHCLPSNYFRIEGDNPVKTIDDNDEGIPNKDWTNKDIKAWLDKYDAKPTGYATKTQLLNIVDTLMNPEKIDEVEDVVDTAPMEDDEDNLQEVSPSGEDITE